MRGLVGAALVAMLAATVASETAHAADTPSSAPVTVHWAAPPTCPAAADIDAAIATLLRASTRTGPLVDARVVVVREASDRFRAEVRTLSEGHQARRTFRAATCQSLADATALLLALMIDPDAAPPAASANAAPPPLPPAPSAPGPLAVTAPPPSSPPPSPRPPPRPASLSPRLQVGAVVDDGTFVGPEAGIEAAIGVDHGPFLLSLGGAYFPALTYNGVGDAGGAEIHFFDVRLVGCVRPLAFAPIARSFPLWVCLGPGLEHLTATLPQLALGFQSLDWASLVAGLAAEPRLGLFGLQLRTELLVPLRRDGLVDDSGNEIFRPSPAAFRGSADLVVHFP